MSKQGMFRIDRTSARLEVNGSYFKLHQPGRCVTPDVLVGALEEIWDEQSVSDNPNAKYKKRQGMSGCRSLGSYVTEWRRAEHNSATVFDVRLPLAGLYISCAGKLNMGAEGMVPEVLALCRHFEITSTPVKLLEEERQEIRYSFEDRRVQNLQVEVRVLSAPDGQVLEEEILSLQLEGHRMTPERNDGSEVFFLDEREYASLAGIIPDCTGQYMLPVQVAEWAYGMLIRAGFPVLGDAPFVRIRTGGDSEKGDSEN